MQTARKVKLILEMGKGLNQRFFLYLTLVSGFMGTIGFSTAVGPIHLFAYRLLLIFLWLLFFACIFINSGQLNLANVKVKKYLLFLLLWMFYAVLSLNWAADKIAGIRNVIFLFMGISLVIFIVFHLKKLSDLKMLYWLWAITLVPLITVGCWEVITGNHLSVSSLYGEERGTWKFAPTAVFRNQNDFAAFLVLSIPFVLAGVRYLEKNYFCLLGLFIIIVSVILLSLTLSRFCYFGLLTGILFWFLFLIKARGKFKVMIIAVFVGAIFLLIAPIQTGEIIEKVQIRLSGLSNFSTQEEGIESAGIRVNLIKNAIVFMVESFGFGVGAGNVEYYMTNYKIFWVEEIVNAHNWWVEILANYGLLIFGGYLIFYLSILRNVWKFYREAADMGEKMIGEGLLVGMVIFPIAANGPSSIIAYEPQWIFIGFLLAFINFFRNKKIAKNIDAYSNHTF